MNCTTCTNPLTPHEAGRYTCTRCTRRITGWMRELPNQLVVLRASRALERTGPPTAQLRTGRAHAPLPGRADVLNLLAVGGSPWTGPDQVGALSIHATLTRWVAHVRAERRLNGPAASAPAETLAAWLTPHWEWAAERHWITEAHREINALMREIRAITRVVPGRRPVPQPCPACDLLTLVEQDWQDGIWCRACGGGWWPEELAIDAAERLARHAAA